MYMKVIIRLLTLVLNENVLGTCNTRCSARYVFRHNTELLIGSLS